jgi:hypothetical protein
MIFTAADLFYRDYSITHYTDGDPRVSGNADDTQLNRREQAEVLYFINYCYKAWKWPEYTKSPGRKLEMLIRSYIPREYSSQEGMLEWISQNWRHYWNLLPGR